MIMILNREQYQELEFLRTATPLHTAITEAGLPKTAKFYNLVVGALNSFGHCELLMRKAERYRALDVYLSAADEVARRAELYNNSGLEALPIITASLNEVREELMELGVGEICSCDIFEHFKSEFRYAISELEIKAADAVKIEEATRRVFDPAYSLNVDGLIDQCQEAVRELEEARRSDDRGVRDNLPWWKWIGIILIAGAFAAIVVACLISLYVTGGLTTPACTLLLSKGVGVLIALVGSLITIFC